MAESEHFGEIASGDQSRPGLRTPSEHLQVGIRRHVGLVHTRQTGVRLQRDLVAPQHRYMVENTWVLAQSRIDLNSSQ